MLKTIRKYNKIILGVGGTLLLIAFLVPQAITQLGQASQGRSVGSMGGQKISVASYDLATRELSAVESFYGELGMSLPLALDPREDVAHWMLLSREAERAGMVGGAAEGAQLLPVFAEMLVRNSYEQQYQRFAQQVMLQDPEGVQTQEADALIALSRIKQGVANRARLMETEFDQTLAKLQGVLRLLNAYRYAERLYSFAELSPDVLRAHADAMRAVIKNEVKGDGGAVGIDLVKSLDALVERMSG